MNTVLIAAIASVVILLLAFGAAGIAAVVWKRRRQAEERAGMEALDVSTGDVSAGDESAWGDDQPDLGPVEDLEDHPDPDMLWLAAAEAEDAIAVKSLKHE